MLERVIEDAIDAWAFTRRNTLAEIENLPADRFDHRPHVGSRSIAEVCHHIVDSGLMFTGEIARSDGSFARLPISELLATHAGNALQPTDRTRILERLQDTWAGMEQTLSGLDPAFLLSDMRSHADQPVCRLRMLHFANGHEFYHTGQLTVYARTLGIVPALTKHFS